MIPQLKATIMFVALQDHLGSGLQIKLIPVLKRRLINLNFGESFLKSLSLGLDITSKQEMARKDK